MIKTLLKHIEVGDYTFDVALNRDIIADSFESFPDLMDFLLSADKGKADVVSKAIREKKVRQVLSMNDDIEKFVKFAFPRMLEAADKEKGTSNAEKAEEILNYISENDVDTEFNAAMFKFICSGFTPETAGKKPKVKFNMN